MINLIDKLGPVLPAPITILDIGSNKEGEPRYWELMQEGLLRVYGFDALDSEKQVVLGDGSEHVFHTTRWSGCSSILEPNPHMIDQFYGIGAGEGGNFEVLDKKVVVTEPLSDFDLPRIDFLKIDTQGSELMILQSGPEYVSTCLMIESEVEFIPVYKDQPLFSDIDLWLRDSFDFQFHKFTDVGSRALKPTVMNSPFKGVSQWMWADAVWMRDIRKLDEEHHDELNKLALLSHYLYGSYDVTARCLSITNPDLAQAYMQDVDMNDNGFSVEVRVW